MADESDKPPEERQQRKTVSFTHRQLGISGGVIAALLSVGQLKELKEFFIGDQATAILRIEASQTAGFSEIKNILRNMDADYTTKIRRLHDLINSDLVAVEGRCEKRTDRIDGRLMNLESYALKTRSPKGSTN